MKGIEYTPAEIEKQPRLWMENFKRLEKKKEEISSFLIDALFGKNSRVILAGAGSSAYIGLSAQSLLRQKWQLDVDMRPTTDIVTHWSSIFLKNADNTLISFARSGNSPESIGALIVADRFCKRVNHVIVTCNKEGRLAQLANEKDDMLLLLLSEETNDRGLAMTASFTTMLMAAQFLAHAENPGEYEPIVRHLSDATQLLFKNYSDILNEAAEASFERAVFLGGGCLYGCAVESGLKIQEMSEGRVVCKADTFLGVRHGPEAVIDDETLVVYFLSSDPFVRRYELDLMQEIKMKGLGLKKIVVCDKANKEIKENVDHALEFDKDGTFNIPDFYRPMMDVTVGQLLGLFKSLGLGLRPDNPSERGIISRVVKGVKIYDDKTFRTKGKLKVVAD
ncbi:MAG: SIS domain-containing protein [Candidatus Bathyarchaeota archaeon]|nr:SIS domain-containing protein [Candidatus Bathyarchaeota archaeon]